MQSFLEVSSQLVPTITTPLVPPDALVEIMVTAVTK